MPVIERNGVLYIRGQVDGERYCKSTKLKESNRNRRRAEVLDLKQVDELSMSRRFNIKPIENIAFSKAMESCREWIKVEYAAKPNTIRTYDGALRHCLAFFREEIVRNITGGDVEQFKVAQSATYMPASVRLRLAALWVFFEFSRKQRWCDSNVVEGVKSPAQPGNSRVRVLTFDEERQYLAKAKAESPLLYDFARMLGTHGLRPSEGSKLEKVDVDLENHQFYIRNAKTPAGCRWVEITPETKEILSRRMDSASPFIFPMPTDSTRHVAYRVMDYLHNRILKGTDLRLKGTGLDFVLYTFRHSFATRLIQGGVNLFTVASLMGHADVSTLKRYVHLAQQTHRDAMGVYADERALRLAS